MKIFVALWSRKTEAVIGEDVRRRQLAEAIDEASQKFQGENQVDFDGAIKWIFVGPEYLFTTERAEAENTTRALSTDTVKGIRKELAGLSRAHPGMLMIPGSIIYQHSIELQTEGLKGAIDTAAAYQQSLAPLARTEAKPRVPALRTELLASSAVPELSIQNKLQLLSTPATVDHLVKNRVFVFLNGKVVATYGKKADKHEVQGPNAGVFLPGKDSGLAEIEGIKFGFEICYDHQMGVLKAVSNDKKVDIHIVVSAWVTNEGGNMQIRPRGYFLHASSDPKYSAVYYKAKTTGLPSELKQDALAAIPDLKDTAKIIPEAPCAGGTLKCYVLPYLASL